VEVDYSSSTTTVEGVLTSTNYYTIQRGNTILAELADARVRQEAILAAVTGGDQEAILAAIQAEGERTRQQLDAQGEVDAVHDAELLTRILAALPAGSGPVSRDELEAALRTVLG
jgi:hypothetical protein